MISAEQQYAIDTLLRDDVELVQTSAVSGSGKTTLLVHMANHFKTGTYLAYNKAIATEAKEKFGPGIECKTTHSLAYRPIVSQGLSMPGIKFGQRKVDFFNWRSVDAHIKYEEKLQVIDYMENYFLSRFVSLTKYLEQSTLPTPLHQYVKKYVKQMAMKEIPCTHAFYLKYYHILLDREVIKPKAVDVVFLDECGDLNEVTLEIFKLLPAKKKVMVGDLFQNIYQFNNTINGFKAMEGQGELCKLTQSFRVPVKLAKKVQTFGRQYLDADMVFKGTDIDTDDESEMYIARYNSSLIARMVELNRHGVEYNLTRKASDIFGLLMTLVNLKPGCKIYRQEYKFLLQDMEYYYKNRDHITSKNLIAYIMREHHADKTIVNACKKVIELGGKLIFDTYNIAKAHESAKTTHKLTLTSGHSSKGLEASVVTLDDDMNLDFLNDEDFPEESIESELKLRYVAITRTSKELVNAGWLDDL